MGRPRPGQYGMRPVMPFGSGRRRRWIPLLSIAVPALGWLTFGFYPTVATLFYSLTQYSGLTGTPVRFVWFYNYVQGFTTDLPQLGSSLLITLQYALGVLVLQTVAGLGLALLLNKIRKSFAVYRALIFLPQVLSAIVVGVVFMLLFDPFAGPLERLYHGITGSVSSFFGSPNISLLLVVVVTAWEGTGFTMVVYIAGLRNIPADYYEALAVDGGGVWNKFRYITWPLLSTSTTVNVFLIITFCMTQYALILVLTQGRFGTMTIGMYMFSSAFGGGEAGTASNLGYGSMLAVLNFLIVLIIGGGALLLLRRREVQL